MLKIITLALIPGIMLIVQNGMNLNTSTRLLRRVENMKENALATFEIAAVVHQLQIERGTSAMLITSGWDPSIQGRLSGAYIQTDRTFRSLSTWAHLKGYSDMSSKENYHRIIKLYREEFSFHNTTLENVMTFYTARVNSLIAWVVYTVTLQGQSTMWAELVAYYLLLLGKEQTGIERALGSTYFSDGCFSLEEVLWYRGYQVLGNVFVEQSLFFSKYVTNTLDKYNIDRSLQDNLVQMRNDILGNHSACHASTQETIWFDNMTECINILKRVQDDTTNNILQEAEEQSHSLTLELITSIILMAVTLLLVPSTVFLITKISKRLTQVADELQEKTAHLQSEQKRTEGLLSQIVPKTIARKLKIYQTVRPEEYESVTVMYGDLDDFSAICHEYSLSAIIQALNELENAIEECLDAYNVNRIGALGTAFLVSAGLPERMGSHHSNIIACLAVDIIEKVKILQRPTTSSIHLKLRLGISTGPVFTGVVGKTIPRYCIMGKTVAQAIKMENTSLPMCIQVTESTRDNLIKDHQFALTERAWADVDMIKSYWLTEREGARKKGRDVTTMEQTVQLASTQHSNI